MPNSSVRVVARIKATHVPRCGSAINLMGLIAPTRHEAGCTTYELWQNSAEQTDFTLVEELESEAALDAHESSQHLKGAAARLQGLILRAPDVCR